MFHNVAYFDSNGKVRSPFRGRNIQRLKQGTNVDMTQLTLLRQNELALLRGYELAMLCRTMSQRSFCQTKLHFDVTESNEWKPVCTANGFAPPQL